MKSVNKKAVLDNLSTLLGSLAALAIVAGVIFLIIAETKTNVLAQDPCGNSTQFYNSTAGACQQPGQLAGAGGAAFSDTYTAVAETQSAASDIPGWLPIVVVAVIGGILLGLVRLFKN